MNPQYYVVGDDITLMSHHDLSHMTIAPFRWMCLAGFSARVCEDQNSDGQLIFAATGEQLTLWVANQVHFVQKYFIIFVFMSFSPFCLLEQSFNMSSSIVLAYTIVVSLTLFTFGVIAVKSRVISCGGPKK